jgi:hypothetical protein
MIYSIQNQSDCPSSDNCNECPEFTIKQHDTRPVFKVDVSDCDQPIDLTDLVIEASMWTGSKLKTAITGASTTISFADNIGFEQINTDTIIQIGNGRLFERMLIEKINEESKTVDVFRGQLNTGSYNWKKGTKIKLLRFLNNHAVGEMEYQDIENLDSTVTKDQLVRSTLIYEFKPGNTCMAGCYVIEFKIMKMNYDLLSSDPVLISQIDYHCDNGAYVEWVRRFPSDREGFNIEVFGSPTAE